MFSAAHCWASLVYSLWEVDETATNRLLLAFYDNLKKDLPKDEALHQAKINYLKNANEVTADPYYWAGFVLQGETNGFMFENEKKIPQVFTQGTSVTNFRQSRQVLSSPGCPKVLASF